VEGQARNVSERQGQRRIRTDGTNTGAFDREDWILTFTIAMLWGSSFLWIAIGLDSLSPSVVALTRVALGAEALWLLPAARRPIPRSVWPTILVVAVAGNAVPALLFAVAQQSVDSSVAAMINSATPIAVMTTGIILTRHTPGVRQIIGIGVGFIGVAAIAAPAVTGADAEPLGVALLAIAVLGYGISNNVIVEPQQRFGAVLIVARALVVASVLLVPFGVVGYDQSELTTEAIVAVVILGVGGTGFARALNATLAGRTGATRGSITTYLVPVIAIGLGVTVRNETIQPIEAAEPQSCSPAPGSPHEPPVSAQNNRSRAETQRTTTPDHVRSNDTSSPRAHTYKNARPVAQVRSAGRPTAHPPGPRTTTSKVSYAEPDGPQLPAPETPRSLRHRGPRAAP